MALIKILAVVFLGVAVAGGGSYLVMNNMASVQTDEEAQMENEADGSIEESGTLRGLLGLGQNLVCTFNSVIDGADSAISGTVSIGGGRMHGDFTATQNGMTFDSHIVIRDEKMYSWTSSSQGTFAYVFDLNDMQSEDNGERSGATAVSLDTPVDYECVAWNVDESKFSLPQGIDFKTMPAVIDTSVDTSAGVSGSAGIRGSAAQCAACEQIPNEAAKTQCLSSLACN